MSDFLDLAAKSGPAALLVGVALAFRYAVEGIKNWRSSRTDGKAAVVSDAATTNAMLLDSLREERAESARKDVRITELEHENAELRETNFSQRRAYEAELGDLRRKLQDITLQLDRFQERFEADAVGEQPA